MIAHVSLWFFSVALTLGLLSHDIWFVLGYGLLISNLVVWPSDHAQDPLNIAIYFHIFWTLATLVGSFTGVLLARAFSLPRLLYTEQLIDNRWTDRTIWMTAMLLSVISAAAGLNFVACRACAGGSGMSPMQLSDTASYVIGATLLVVGVAVLIASIVMLWRGDKEGAITVKYFPFMLGTLAGLQYLHDHLTINLQLGVWQGGVTFLALWVVLMFLLWLWIYYVPAPGAARNFDKFYGNASNSTIFVVSYGVATGVVALATFIVIWATDYMALAQTLIATGVAALAVVAVLLVIINYYQETTAYVQYSRAEPIVQTRKSTGVRQRTTLADLLEEA